MDDVGSFYDRKGRERHAAFVHFREMDEAHQFHVNVPCILCQVDPGCCELGTQLREDLHRAREAYLGAGYCGD